VQRASSSGKDSPKPAKKGSVDGEVTRNLYSRLDEKQPRKKSAAFKRLDGSSLSWRDKLVAETVRWAKENGKGDVNPDILKKKAAG
jgi:hypothetical protein